MTDKDYAGGAATQAMGIAKSIKPLLAYKGPDVQGAVLAELLATWLAGHRRDMRDEILANLLQTVNDLLPIHEADMFRGGPRPEGWGP